MTIKIAEVSFPKDLNEIPISPRLYDVIHQASSEDWQNLFKFVRLSLQNRISGLPTVEDVIKLQGKLDGIQEVQQLFNEIFRK